MCCSVVYFALSCMIVLFTPSVLVCKLYMNEVTKITKKFMLHKK